MSLLRKKRHCTHKKNILNLLDSICSKNKEINGWRIKRSRKTMHTQMGTLAKNGNHAM
jgi:hypothetical protein